jgi:hypothetical protein
MRPHPGIVQLLCDAKGEPDREDKNKHTLLEGLFYGHAESCQKGGHDQDQHEQNTCSRAAIARILLSAKTDPNKTGAQNPRLALAPVAIAASRGCLGSVCHLLNAGALLFPDDQRKFNYLCGECKEHEGMVALLQEARAKQQQSVLKPDHDGRILWGNIGAVAALALVLGYAFY